MRILGIDPALSVTGYGVIDTSNNKLLLIHTGTIITTTEKNYPFRLREIYSKLLRVVTRFHPNVMVMEKLYIHFRHPTTAYILGQVKGIICLLSAEKNIPLYEYASTRIRKSLIGVGQASKEQIQRMVTGILNIKRALFSTDITDALAAALAHYYISRKENFYQEVAIS
ncbi:MAG: crossover junction endodeoxyribonuclease RuvC [Candidatus Omnitrophica bacterium]|nr:crossover junction endodeoxyribonuclease RuvC [Candidatus Omnitrophota bacterium]